GLLELGLARPRVHHGAVRLDVAHRRDLARRRQLRRRIRRRAARGFITEVGGPASERRIGGDRIVDLMADRRDVCRRADLRGRAGRRQHYENKHDVTHAGRSPSSPMRWTRARKSVLRQQRPATSRDAATTTDAEYHYAENRSTALSFHAT